VSDEEKFIKKNRPTLRGKAEEGTIKRDEREGKLGEKRDFHSRSRKSVFPRWSKDDTQEGMVAQEKEV